MKKYIEIQNEVLKDYKVNSNLIKRDRKNSAICTYNIFYDIGLIKTKNEDIAFEFADELADDYGISKFLIEKL